MGLETQCQGAGWAVTGACRWRRPVGWGIGLPTLSIVVGLGLLALWSPAVGAQDLRGEVPRIHLGPRPLFLVDDMAESDLKRRLQACEDQAAAASDFTFGHRGAPLQFPEHTRESYLAAARMGAGIIECDVVFTKDAQLVCRHAQDDLASTTNILVTDLADTCVEPFVPATFDRDGTLVTPARATCRTSEITAAEFLTLRGKMDGFNVQARSPEEALLGTARWRTDLYSGPTSGTLLTHADSIELFKGLGVGMTPELKIPSVPMPFASTEGELTQDELRQKVIDDYKAAGVPPDEVWIQSFDPDDVLYWVGHEPDFGRRAVWLEGALDPSELPTDQDLRRYAQRGIKVVGAPLFSLLAVDGSGQIVPSPYAVAVRGAGLDIVAWTLERSGILAAAPGDFYYQTVESAISRDGDVYRILDVLAQDVGVVGVFTDWPATVTFYANCFGL